MRTTKILEAAAVWVGASTVGKMLDTHPVTLWRWCRAGTFPAPIYFGNQRRWRLADVEQWIAAQAAKTSDPRHGAPTEAASGSAA